MAATVIYTISSVLLVSLVSLIGIIPLLLKKKLTQHTLLLFVSLSAGTLFAGAFLHLIPEAVEEGFTITSGLLILAGIMLFFLLEKFIHWHHTHHKYSKQHTEMHGHAYHLAPLNLIGDGIHNFLDGIIIATSYGVSIPLGIATTLGVVFHEIPQEIADFGVLLYSGITKLKALLFNFLSAVTALLGAIFGLMAYDQMEGFSLIIIPIAAGSFIYIAGSNLVPELHKHCTWKDSLWHFLAMLLGIAIMIGLLFVE